MTNDDKLNMEINAICEDILDNIIGPIYGIKTGIWADIFLADIDVYATMEDRSGEVIIAICERYKLPSIDRGNETYIEPIDSWWTLASIALYIILYSKNTKFYDVGDCDFCGNRTACICGPYDNLICLKCADKFDKGEIQ